MVCSKEQTKAVLEGLPAIVPPEKDFSMGKSVDARWLLKRKFMEFGVSSFPVDVRYKAMTELSKLKDDPSWPARASAILETMDQAPRQE